MNTHTLDKNDIRIIYNLKNKPTEVLIKYSKFMKLIEVIEDKKIEKELIRRIKRPEFVDESEILGENSID